MSGPDRIRRQWTHRRLGLGASLSSDAAQQRTDALLTAVGARRTTSGFVSDDFEAALMDFVLDIDVLAEVAAVDASPVPIAALRARISPPKQRRMSWRVLVPAAGSGLAAVVIALTLLLVGGSAPALTPAQSATAESKALLSHADLLLTAAQTATATERTKLVTEAKADLSHVSRLVPLAPGPEQPAIRAQMQLLNNRARPLWSPPPSGSAPGGNGSPGGQTGPGTAPASTDSTARSEGTPPVRRKPSRRPPPAQSGAGTGSATGSGGAVTPGSQPRPPRTNTSGQPTSQATGTGSTPRRQPGTYPPPPPGGGTQGGTYQQPPPPAGG